MPTPARDGPRPTLGAVVTSISALRIVCAPLGPNVPLAAVRVAEEDTAVGRNDLLLARTDDPAALRRLMARAGDAGASALAVPGHAESLSATALDRGIALLHTSASWDRLLRLATRALEPAALPEPAGPVTVVAFEPAARIPDAQVLRNVVWYLTALHARGTHSATEGRVCYAVVPGDHDVTALAGVVARRAGGGLGVELRAGVGATRTGPGRTTASRDDADRVLDVLRRRPDLGLVAALDDVRAHAAIVSIGSLVADWPHLRQPELAVLREHDAAHETGYVTTLAAYLAHFGDTTAAAADLGLHPNTFRYRLRRLLALTGLDLADPARRLACQLDLAVPA